MDCREIRDHLLLCMEEFDIVDAHEHLLPERLRLEQSIENREKGVIAMRDLLKRLTDACGVSGDEQQVADILLDEARSLADECFQDALGNVIVFKQGTGAHKKRVMVSAHMDEIGFAVMAVNDKGFIRVRNLGGVPLQASVMNKLRFRHGAVGLIQTELALGDLKEATQLYVDIGAVSKEDALKYVSIGESACYAECYAELPNQRATNKAMDDRVGCYIAIESLKRMKEVYNDVYFVFSVQEEVGIRGARVAAARINPDAGIAVDITGSSDTPGSGDGNLVMGRGAAIKVMDGSVICDRYLIDAMMETAKDHGIRYQMEVLSAGGTDASAINQSNFGVRAGGISIPTRYGHGTNSMVDLSDVDSCIDLLTRFLDRKLDF